MRDRATLALVERDAGIPSLGVVLSSSRLSEAIRNEAASTWGDVTITPEPPRYVRYKPWQNCIAVHRARTEQGSTVELYAKAFGPDTAVKIEKAREFASVRGPLGPGTVILPKSGVVLATFPNDAKLARLRRISGGSTRCRLLARIFGDSVDPEQGTLARLAYKPERRYVVRLDVGGTPTAVVKFSSARAFKRSRRAALAVSETGIAPGSRPIGKSRRYAALAFAWQPGMPLRDVSKSESQLDRRVGEWLRELHGSHAPGLSRTHREVEIRRLIELSRNLNILVPGAASRADDLVATLTEWLAREPLVEATLHGDLYDKQILVSGSEITVIDWDEASLGDPRSDCGQYVAHLEWDVIRADLDEAEGNRRIHEFLEGYASADGALPEGLSNYVAIGLFRLAHHPFRAGAREWDRKISALLDRAEVWLNRPEEVACGSCR